MSRTILIVDDSKTERVVLNGYLKAEYDLIEAASGEEAIEILRTQWERVSGIVLDIIMPGMDGFETLRTIKTNAQWHPIPVVITTGLDDEDSREKAIALGADSFVTKPFNRMLLLHVVDSAVKLREMAVMADQIRRDSLTGLLSRDSFFTEAERMIRRREPGYYILSCIDIENFKVINDQYGTGIGDAVLMHIARMLNGFVGGINGLCGRYMADQFAVLYPAGMKHSKEIKNHHAVITAPPCIPRPIRICVGRYPVDDASLPVSAMFDRAALAAESVKGRYDAYIGEYNEKMRGDLLREQQIVSNMAGALENGEFVPWFQPQYNHVTGALVGAEALVRWCRHGAVVYPADFVPVFEKNGFIYEVDKSVWRQVCAHLRRWLDAGRTPLPISVNISRYDLLQPDFMRTICGLVDEYALPIDLLRLEITESAFAEATKVIIEMAGMLIERGFTVEIDDFGSGYSSLNTLKDVPASILKLDMRFFETSKNSVRGGNIVESIVRMAKWLGMSVIAEGVEDKSQADYLKTIGCYYIQGYYYARPMPVTDYEAEMEQRAGEAHLSRLETLETLDSNLFWDPKSMETLIFNSYAGGACIFEAHDSTTELLRVNDQYVRELHGLVPDGAQLKDSSIVGFIDAEGRGIIRKTLLSARDTGRAASCEVRLSDGKQVEYIRYTARMIAKTNERRLYYAVIVNITEQREKEAIYSRWQNSIAERPADSYTLLRCNLSKNTTFDSREGTLLTIDFEQYANSLDERTQAYIAQCVYADDRDHFRAFLNIDTMLAEYYRGRRTDSIEFREYVHNGEPRWLRLSVDLVEYADSPDVQAYLMFEDIDEHKRMQLRILEQAQTDPLTALLNRTTFAMRANQIMSESASDSRHALLLLDIDGFKQVNDVFGHGAGDQALIEIADLLTRFSRKEDLVGRLGGDEFIVFLTNVPSDAVAAKIARQLCACIRKTLGMNVSISASIGIAMFPQDGAGFESLYKAADRVLYRVKGSGKNGYAFTRDDPVSDDDAGEQPSRPNPAARTRLRRILIVDDSPIDLQMLSGLFKNDFRVEKATDGATALMKLRHYGTAISVVLLDLNLPDMDGYEVLSRMQQDEATHTIPVIVVSADEQRETALKVIRAGADDLIVKPVEPDILRVRVEAAINRTEYERLRVQSSYLSMRNAELCSYLSALDHSGIMVITLDWGKNEFSYSPSVSERLAGTYDGKKLWSALMLGMAADVQTVQKMQQLVHSVAEDRERTNGSMTVSLRTSSGVFSSFEMSVYKEVNDFGLAGRILITLRDIRPAQREQEQIGE